jgi:hypothetical protein
MDGLRTALEAIQAAALAYPVKDLAPQLDKAPSTLYDELSLSRESKAKLGFADAVRIMVLTKDHRPLQALAALLGYTLSRPEPISRDIHHMQALRAVTDFLEAHARGDDYQALSPVREAAVEALETLWMQRRSEVVMYRRRGPALSKVAAPAKHSWWRRWRRG